jgi:hypothetical protein
MSEFQRRLEANIRESLRFAVGEVQDDAVAHMVAGVNAVLNHPCAPSPSEHVVLAPKHTGLRVDYTGLLKSARQGLQREPGTAEMLNQLEEHLSELGRRWYDGDATVVDEFLQLYCIQRVRRDVLTAGTTEGQDNG